MTINDADQALIDDVLDQFDFETVRDVMKATNWRWHGGDSPPDIPCMRRVARGLLRSAVQAHIEPYVHVYESTGGFVASYDGYALSLRFVVEECEACKDIGSPAGT